MEKCKKCGMQFDAKEGLVNHKCDLRGKAGKPNVASVKPNPNPKPPCGGCGHCGYCNYGCW